MRTFRQRFARQLQRRDRLLPRHARERIKELLEAVAGREIIDQVLQQYARTDEHGFAAQNVWIAMNNRSGGGHDDLWR